METWTYSVADLSQAHLVIEDESEMEEEARAASQAKEKKDSGSEV